MQAMAEFEVGGPVRPRPETVPVKDRVVFQPTVQSLFARLPPGKLTPELKAEVKRLGLDLERPLLPAYPLALWIQVLDAVARAVYPAEAPEQAHRQLGQRLIEGYVETGIGRALFALLKLIGPRRTLGRTAKSFRSGNNYCEATVTEVTPTEFELWMNEVGTVPTLVAGVLQSGLGRAGATNVKVVVLRADGVGVTYRVTWD